VEILRDADYDKEDAECTTFFPTDYVSLLLEGRDRPVGIIVEQDFDVLQKLHREKVKDKETGRTLRYRVRKFEVSPPGAGSPRG
jgi:hypothetical protein